MVSAPWLAALQAAAVEAAAPLLPEHTPPGSRAASVASAGAAPHLQTFRCMHCTTKKPPCAQRTDSLHTFLVMTLSIMLLAC
jgi:hypothetical protein